MKAQRVKTSGPNPNPTAQAQSKRWLPLSTKTQNIIEFVCISASILGAFFEHFPQKWPKGSRATPKSAHKTPPWTPRVPKWSPRVPNQGLPKVPKRLPTTPHVCQNGHPRCHNGSPRPPEVPKRHHKAPQSAKDTHKCQQAQLDTNALGKAPGCHKNTIQTARGRVLAAGDVDPAAGRGTTHQAACRSPRSGAEAENRGTSSKGFVLEVN